MKHTPKPWRAVVIGGSTEIHAGQSMATLAIIPERTEEHDANGRLMALSPEMFEALRSIRAAYRSNGNTRRQKEAFALIDRVLAMAREV